MFLKEIESSERERKRARESASKREREGEREREETFLDKNFFCRMLKLLIGGRFFFFVAAKKNSGLFQRNIIFDFLRVKSFLELACH